MAPPPPVCKNIDDFNDDIFVTRVSSQAWLRILVVLLSAVTTTVIGGKFDLTTYTVIFTIVYTMISNMVPKTYYEIRARTNFVADEKEDRPICDRSKMLTKGKVYSLSYYVRVHYLFYNDIQAHGFDWSLHALSVIDPFFSAFCERNHLSCSTPEYVSTSLFNEIVSRKTLFSEDPQVVPLAQRMDGLPTNMYYLQKLGLNVGICTLKLFKLMHLGTHNQHFHLLRLTRDQYNTGTYSTTQELKLYINASRAPLEWIYARTKVLVMYIIYALLLALVVAFILSATLYLYPVLRTHAMSWAVAPSELVSRGLQRVLQWTAATEEPSGGSQSYSSSSFKHEDTSSHSNMPQASCSGSMEPDIQAEENYNYLKTIMDTTKLLRAVYSKIVLAVFVTAWKQLVNVVNYFTPWASIRQRCSTCIASRSVYQVSPVIAVLMTLATIVIIWLSTYML